MTFHPLRLGWREAGTEPGVKTEEERNKTGITAVTLMLTSTATVTFKKNKKKPDKLISCFQGHFSSSSSSSHTPSITSLVVGETLHLLFFSFFYILFKSYIKLNDRSQDSRWPRRHSPTIQFGLISSCQWVCSNQCQWYMERLWFANHWSVDRCAHWDESTINCPFVRVHSFPVQNVNMRKIVQHERFVLLSPQSQ